MTRNRIAPSLLALVAALAAAVWLLSALHNEAQAESGVISPAVAGTALMEADVPGLGPLLLMVTYHADGTITSTDQSDFGLGGLASKNTAAQGMWSWSGPQESTAVLLFFNLDANGVPSPSSVVRATAVTSWSPGMAEGVGVYTQRVYNTAAGEDPLDPNDGTPVPGEIPYSLRRLTE